MAYTDRIKNDPGDADISRIAATPPRTWKTLDLHRGVVTTTPAPYIHPQDAFWASRPSLTIPEHLPSSLDKNLPNHRQSQLTTRPTDPHFGLRYLLRRRAVVHDPPLRHLRVCRRRPDHIRHVRPWGSLARRYHSTEKKPTDDVGALSTLRGRDGPGDLHRCRGLPDDLRGTRCVVPRETGSGSWDLPRENRSGDNYRNPIFRCALLCTDLPDEMMAW